MKRFTWLIIFICLMSFAVFAQKAKLPSKIGDGFVLEFAAPYNRITIDTSEKNLPNREFSEIFITTQTKFQNYKGKPAAPEAIRAGMKVEVKLDPANSAQLTALQIKIRTNFENWETEVDGYLDRVEDEYAFVDGAKVALPPNTALAGKGQIFTSLKDIPLGSLLDLKGVRQPNGSVLIKQGTVKPNVFTLLESQLVEKLKQGLTVPPPGKSGAGVKIGEQTYKVVEDLDVNAFVNRVGNRIVPRYLRNLPPEDPNKVLFRFYVLEDETPNAVAFSDGSVFVHTGILKRLENEAQLAIVLGHEIAHVTNEHVRRRAEAAGNQALLAAVIGAAAGKSLGQESGELVTKLGYVLLSNKFSADMEDQADRVGLYYAHQAGYDVREAPQIWRRLMGDYKETTAGNVLYADHPAMLARLRDMRREVVSNYAAADFSEVTTGREKYVEGVGGYFGWIQPKPKQKPNVPQPNDTKSNPKPTTRKPVVRKQTTTTKPKIPMDLVKQIMSDNDQQSVVSDSFGGDIQKFADSLDVKLIDLNTDGQTEYLIISPFFCGASNCPVFVYQKTGGNNYKLLFDEYNLKPRLTITNGYRDLQAASQSGADDVRVATYKFNGSEYKLADCVRIITDRSKKRPIVTRQKCN